MTDLAWFFSPEKIKRSSLSEIGRWANERRSKRQNQKIID